MKQRDKLEIIAKYYGKKQLLQTVEESAELMQAISKYIRKPSNETLGHILEEIADVEIMTAQLRMIFNVDNTVVEDIKDMKINRQIERIRNEVAIKKEKVKI